MTEQDKVTVDDIIGIVKTEEATDSVEEVRKLRGRGNETAKRFTRDEHTGYLYDNGEIVEDVMKLLNALNDENEQLKKDREELFIRERDTKNDWRELKQENEQLKKELKVYRKVASCNNCHYHNYDWFDDGDEFEVCDKRNDVTDGICEDWEGF